MKDLLSLPSHKHWKESLAEKMPANYERDINNFELDIVLKKQGKIEAKLFAETRLRMGAYGQRYDNGKRHDGKQDRPIPFPQKMVKGPGTDWDAPGMERIKLPFGGLNAEQMDVFADLSEEYSDGISHITTRQDIQLHYIHIENTPAMFRRLAAVNITTREACGNSVRNITADPLAGVSQYEVFDVTPYAHALFEFLLGHPDVQDFGRKLKIALSGDMNNSGGLVFMHDVGFVARMIDRDGKQIRGFDVYVGGGLGAVPYKAKLLAEAVTEEEILPITQATCRIFARYGEKKKRHRARIKFLVAQWGIEKFREEVKAEREKLTFDPRWNTYLKDLNRLDEKPLKAPGGEIAIQGDAEYVEWLRTNVIKQKQKGYVAVEIACPLGDITANQMRELAQLAREFVAGTVRTTVEQNLMYRWLSTNDLPAFYQRIKAIGLGQAGAGCIIDVTACPGTDTCKLGISSSRGLAVVLRNNLQAKFFQMDQSVRDLKIKVSGCFNSCGQQHVADIGFYGISRNVNGFVVPHFQVVLGGKWAENGSEYGLPIGGLPSKSVPLAVDRLTDMYLSERQTNEGFRAFVQRTGKSAIMKRLQDLTSVPAYDFDKSYYVDWGDVREYSVRDKGIGECAGEIVTLTDFALKTADREYFEASEKFDANDLVGTAELAYQSMKHAAQGLIKFYNIDISEDPDQVMQEFRERLWDTEIFHDPIAGDRCAHYYFHAHEDRNSPKDREEVHRLMQEAQIFVEASHACNMRIEMKNASVNGQSGLLAQAAEKEAAE